MTETSNLPPIPDEHAQRLRQLLHDLSNALEIVLQTNYLLSVTPLDDTARQWQQMLDQGVKQATNLNRELREYVRAQSKNAAGDRGV
ncbi:MAG TPA: hypothetical protein VHT24_08245 [Pseudacidobacterium sp.]|jgi:type II secretory pathway component PulM|nr:hypothetical protein [Pseudacidobacterium sp.]